MLTAPKIDQRSREDIFRKIREMAPLYLPQWDATQDSGPGAALSRIFAGMLETVIHRLNGVPDKNFVAFLDMLGVKLIPPQPARVPITFVLSEGARENVLVPARTQAAAGEVIFETEKAFVATPAKVKKVYGVKEDQIFEAPLDRGFELFEGENKQKHILYLGDDSLFNITGKARIQTGLPALLADMDMDEFAWSYHEKGQEKPGKLKAMVDDGCLVLDKEEAGEIQEEKIHGHDSRWIQCECKNALKYKLLQIQMGPFSSGASPVSGLSVRMVQGIGEHYAGILVNSKPPVATIEDLLKLSVDKLAKILGCSILRAANILEAASKAFYDKMRLAPGEDTKVLRQGLLPDLLFFNDVPLDTTVAEDSATFKTHFHPLGSNPRPHDCFYIASQEAFSKKGAKVTIKIAGYISLGGKPTPEPLFSAEYWDGNGWAVLVALTDPLKKAISPGLPISKDLIHFSPTLKFEKWPEIKRCRVNGQENFWIRLRLVGGHFGQDVCLKEAVVETGKVTPPIVTTLSINYSSKTSQLKYYLIENNLDLVDITENIKSGEKSTIFKTMEPDTALYFGFDKKLEKGPVSVFFDIAEQINPPESSRIEWQYLRKTDEMEQWQRLESLDNTHSFTRAGTLEFVFAPDIAQAKRFGNELYWIRAKGFENNSAPISIRGIYLNTAWALQAATVREEILGSSDGAAGQRFFFSRSPVFSSEVWVNEVATLTDVQRKAIMVAANKETREVLDEKGNLREFWIRWTPVEDLLRSAKNDRHYELDGSAGYVRFGNGISGRIPPIGRNNVMASYRTGGGSDGNVDSATVTTLKTSVPFVDKVFNPFGAGGGTDKEGVEAALDRGTHILRNNSRGVTAEDYEFLVRQSAPGIGRVKCIPFTPDTGCVLVVIVPATTGEKPVPTLQLRSRIEEFLREHVAWVVIAGDRLRVTGPSYVRVSVSASVVACAPEFIPSVEKEALVRIRAFLNPLTGGDKGKGWEFGRLPFQSDFYSLLEKIEGVDHVASLSVGLARDAEKSCGGITLPSDQETRFQLLPCEIVYSGTHKITVKT